MKCSELLAHVQSELPRLEADALTAIQPLSDDQFNAQAGTEWSVAKVVRHLILSHKSYLEAIERLLPDAAKHEDEEARHSFFGKFVVRASGPRGNSPTPGAFVPEEGRYGKSVVEEWTAQNNRLVELAKLAEGKDLNSTRFPNPIVRMFKMNLTDGFRIPVVHTDRHVRQIVERAAMATAPV